MAADHNAFANLIWQIADLLRGPYRPPQYERVMLPMTVLRRFDCVLAETKAKVVAAHEKHKGGKLAGDARLSDEPEAIGREMRRVIGLDDGWAAEVKTWSEAVTGLRGGAFQEYGRRLGVPLP